MAPAVNEDITSSTVRARAAETLRGVALLQRALVLLHGQAVVGQTQLLVGCFWVQLEGLACEETEFCALSEICYCVLASNAADDNHHIIIIITNIIIITIIIIIIILQSCCYWCFIYHIAHGKQRGYGECSIDFKCSNFWAVEHAVNTTLT